MTGSPDKNQYTDGGYIYRTTSINAVQSFKKKH